MSRISELSEGQAGMSVGGNIGRFSMLNSANPRYQRLASAVSEQLEKITRREDERYGNAPLLAITEALTHEEVMYLGKEYPEFSVVLIKLNSPGHKLFRSLRKAANAWLALQIKAFSASYVHFGADLLQSLVTGSEGAHMEIDPSDPNMVHTMHSGRVDCHRIYTDPVSVAANFGLALDPAEYIDHCRRIKYRVCDDPGVCTHQAVGFAADLTLAYMSPFQFASAMLQHGSSVGYGFFMYHESMLVSESGTLPQFGISFERTASEIRFKYPDGQAGVGSYPLEGFSLWCVTHTVPVGPGNVQFELLKTRGCFMFFRATYVDSGSTSGEISHALELKTNVDKYLVKTYKLRSLTSDPESVDSWVPVAFTVPRRLIEKVYAHGLALEAKQFTPYAIKKQIKIDNDRVVVQGTSVTVHHPLDPDTVELLSSVMYTRLFVDRYHLGTLVAELMDLMKDVSRFSEISVFGQLALVVRLTVASVWDSTGASLSKRLSKWCKSMFYRPGKFQPVGLVAQISMAPTYVLMSQVAKNFNEFKAKEVHSLAAKLTMMSISMPADPMMPGYAVAVGAARDWSFSSQDYASVVSLLSDISSCVDDTTKNHFGYALGNHKTSSEMQTDQLDVVQVVKRDDSVLGAADFGPNPDQSAGSLLEAMLEVNDMGSMPYVLQQEVTEELLRRPPILDSDTVDFELEPDPISALNEAYNAVLPGVAAQNMEFDTAGISTDDQHRVLSANYMQIPLQNDLPKPRDYYHSKLKALNIPKRQETVQEMVSSLAARNLSAPQVARPQDNDVIIPEIFDNFLKMFCVDDARDKLERFKQDPVALSKEAFEGWMKQAKVSTLEQAKKMMDDHMHSLDELDVSDYLVILKADVKPTLSLKPLDSRTEPQVIVYHNKVLSALFSSVFRILVARFLSLLKPNVHINLKKDLKDIQAFITAAHPYGKRLSYLENDFSKYDKSQESFAFALEEYVFSALGMREDLLDKWVDGHVVCNLRSLTMGIKLEVLYQRKSGDATTAFGNVILNAVSVAWAYRGTTFSWAVFMGDDSIIAAHKVCNEDTAVQVLAEVFNLQSKFYITDAPYFASNFIVVNPEFSNVVLMPDPIKRIERWSMHVSAEAEDWADKYRSAVDTMAAYKFRCYADKLPELISQRYAVKSVDVASVPASIATLISSYDKFRSIWDELPQRSNY